MRVVRIAFLCSWSWPYSQAELVKAALKFRDDDRRAREKHSRRDTVGMALARLVKPSSGKHRSDNQHYRRKFAHSKTPQRLCEAVRRQAGSRRASGGAL